MLDPSEFQVRITNQAFSHLAQIHFYISKVDFRPLVADQVLQSVEKTILIAIPKNPYKYPECAAKRTYQKMYRQVLVKNFKVIFRIADNTITIIGIVHSSRSKSVIKKLSIK